MNIDEPNFYPGVVSEVTGVPPTTLRTWRTRNGLFGGAKGDSWNEFTFLEVCVVLAVKLLTEQGIGAKQAISIAEGHLALCMRKVADKPKDTMYVAFRQDGSVSKFYIGGKDTTAAEIMEWAGGVCSIIDLRALMEDMHEKLKDRVIDDDE